MLDVLKIWVEDTSSVKRVEYYPGGLKRYRRRELLALRLNIHALALRRLTFVDCMPDLSESTNDRLYANLTHLDLIHSDFKGQGFTLRHLVMALQQMPNLTHLSLL
jgi:hypothetical protein